ncbi:MAG TPA: hypothetical protein VGE45_01730 [Chloroflexia bacterium]|jgi:hypothetical protein
MSDILEVLAALGYILPWLLLLGNVVWFYIRGEYNPRVVYSHRVEHWSINGSQLYVRVTWVIENKGKLKVRLMKGCIRLYRIQPWPHAELIARLKDGDHYLNPGENEIDWPVLEHRDLHRPHGPLEIEPGEIDEIPFDFVISGDNRLVMVYSYLGNEKKKRKVGWNKWTIIDLSAEETAAMVSNNRDSKNGNKNGKMIERPGEQTQQGQKPIRQRPPVPVDTRTKGGK